MIASDFNAISRLLDTKISTLNFKVNPKYAGKTGKVDKSYREYRLIQINENNAASKDNLIKSFPSKIKTLKYKNKSVENLQFNKVSPNSGSFPSFSFVIDGQKFDIVISGKAKGAGGFEFEDQLADDLNNYFIGKDVSKLTHPDTVKELIKVLKLPEDESYSAVKTTTFGKRVASYGSSGFSFSNNTGKTIADILIKKGNKDLHYLSLKVGKTFYVVNASVGEYFRGKDKKNINEFFGFDGTQMGGFGEEFVVKTTKPNYNKVKSNLQDILEQAYGTQLVVVHKKASNDNYVAKIGNSSSVSITGLDENSYLYPGPSRKYANIKVQATINNKRHNINFQFRGTKPSDIGPKYLRILLERL